MKTLFLLLIVFACLNLSAEVSFQITYTGFTPAQEEAFAYAASLWQPL